MGSGSNLQEENHNQVTALHYACQYNPKLAEFLIKTWTCHLNSPTKIGNTPLHFACKNPETTEAFIDFLVKQGANHNLRNNDGESPLDWLREREGKEDLVEKLLKYRVTLVIK